MTLQSAGIGRQAARRKQVLFSGDRYPDRVPIMLIQHTPVCLGWNEERAILPSATGEETQAGLHFLELKHLRKSCLGRWGSKLSGQHCWPGEIRIQLCSLCIVGTFPGAMKILRAHQDILLICRFQLSEEFRTVWPSQDPSQDLNSRLAIQRMK